MDGEISTDAVRDALADGDEDPVLVDIRQPGAYRRGHIPGSHNVPFQALPERIPALFGEGDAVADDDGTIGDADPATADSADADSATADSADADSATADSADADSATARSPTADPADADHVVTVCPHGEASQQAARLIASLEGVDATVESMAGGLSEWDGELVQDVCDVDGDAGVDSAAGVDDDGEGPDAPF